MIKIMIIMIMIVMIIIIIKSPKEKTILSGKISFHIFWIEGPFISKNRFKVQTMKLQFKTNINRWVRTTGHW